MRLNLPFIPLPYRFDVERMAAELAQFEDSLWIEHPDQTRGNTALALISLHGGDNHGFRGEMKPTPHLERCPYLQQVIASFGEVFGRSRLMRLAPGCEVREHVDYHYHWHNHVRIHIPIITTAQVIFYCDDEQMHMQAGECWIFDSWRPHNVVNRGTQARTHLVIDTAGSSRFWETVDRGEAATRAGAPIERSYVAYQPGRRPELLTERYNLQPVLSPGEVEYLTHDLIADFETVPGNDPDGVAAYKRIMLAFCRDWRALWYRYGMHRNGWPHYAQLVGATRRALPDVDPPLRLNNRLGLAKSAFSGRILAVAVSPEVYEDFIALPTNSASISPQQASQVIAEDPGSPAVEAFSAAATHEVSRNAPCPCGSGQRYKHCHGASPATD